MRLSDIIGMTLCSGIGAPEVAAPWVDWRFASEIEPFPRAVLQERFGYKTPDHQRQGEPLLWGDMTEVTPDLMRSRGIPLPELIVAGTPCQAFSVAGSRKGLADARGNLTLAFVEICHAIVAARPDGRLAVLWENVPGVLSDRGNAFGCFLGGLVGALDALPPPGNGSWPGEGMVQGPRARAAWAVLDAQWFGVAQRRRRVFVVVDFGNCIDPAAVLLEPDRLRGNSAPRREAGERAAASLTASAGGCSGKDNAAGRVIASTGDVAHCLNAGGMGRQDYETETMVAHTLKGEGFDASERPKKAKDGEPRAFLDALADHSGVECVLWPFGRFKSGYGCVGKNGRAHRVMCEIAHGPAPDAADAAHSCGNRLCVNPRHLRWASRTENMADAIIHGTTTRGERHGASKLTADDVRLILARLDAGETHQSIADNFGVSRNAITDIAKGKNWSWLREDGTGRGTPLVPVAFDCKGTEVQYSTDGSHPTLRSMGHSASHQNAGGHAAVAFDMRGREGGAMPEGPHDTANIRAASGGSSRSYIAHPWAVRRLTPVETARLQGFADDHTAITYRGKPAADGTQYKAHGNSMAVPVIRWIMERMRISMEDNA